MFCRALDIHSDASTSPTAFNERGRILLVAPQPFFQERGTPIALKYVLRALSSIGFEVDVLTLPIGQPVDIPGVRLYRVPNPFEFRTVPIGFSLRKLFFDILIWSALRRRLRAGNYVMIHAVEEAAFLAVMAARGHGVPVLYDMQSSLPEQLQTHTLFGTRPAQKLISWLEKWLLHRVDSVVCSAGLERHVQSLEPDKPVDRWIFPSEMASDDHRPSRLRTELSIPDGAKVVAYTGSFAEYQGTHMLLEALPILVQRNPDAYFVLVGASGPQEATALRDGLPRDVQQRVRVLPRVSKKQISDFLQLADIAISLRKYGRNFPLKIFDYLAASKPIVATDIPAHRAVLDDSLAQLVTPDADGLARGIEALLRDEGRRRELARTATDYARETLSFASFVQRYRNTVYETLSTRVTVAETRSESGEIPS